MAVPYSFCTPIPPLWTGLPLLLFYIYILYSLSLGLIEIFGLAHILQATDAMGKAASVEINGYENVASGYISVLAEGDVAACRAAVDAGVKAVESSGGQICKRFPCGVMNRYNIAHCLNGTGNHITG